MPKQIIRVAFSVLIALVLVAGIYTSVLGASQNVGTRSAQAYISAGVNLGLRQNQNSAQKLDSFVPKSGDQSEGGCHHDSVINPEDY